MYKMYKGVLFLSALACLVLGQQAYAFSTCRMTQIFIQNNSTFNLHYAGSDFQEGTSNWQVGLLQTTIKKGEGAPILISSVNPNDRINLQGYIYFTDDMNKKYYLSLYIPMRIKYTNPYLAFHGLSAHMVTNSEFSPINTPTCLAYIYESIIIDH